MTSIAKPFKLNDQVHGKIMITIIKKLKTIKENISLEPLVICNAIPSELMRLATQNLNLEKVCRVKKNYGDAVCDALISKQNNYNQQEELAVQQSVAAIESWKNVILTAIPCFLILFLGAWTDRTGNRKVCILVPIIGEFLVCVSSILSVYFYEEIPVEVGMFFEGFFPAVTGSHIVRTMGIYVYLNDTTSNESRTFKVGIINLSKSASYCISNALSGVMLRYIGYYGVFLFCAVLLLCAITYGMYIIENPKKSDCTDDEKINVCSFLKSFFDIKHVKDTLAVTIKKGPNRSRTKMALLFISVFLWHGKKGELNVRYLFTRYRFNWNALTYSFYNTFRFWIQILGSSIAISILVRRLKWQDATLGLLTNLSDLLLSLVMCIARNSMEIYLGKILSVCNLIQMVATMVSGPIYSWIYIVFLDVDACAIYYISVLLTLPMFIILGWFYKQHNNMLQKQKAEKIDSNDLLIIRAMINHANVFKMASRAKTQEVNKEECRKNKTTFIEKLRRIKENISLEPLIICNAIPSELSKLATQNLNLDKACRVKKNYGDAVCDELIARQSNNFLREELEVQQLVAAIESWKNVILTAIPCFLILFLGAWSDRTGKRKMCILVPIFGEFLVCVSSIFSVYFFKEIPVEVAMFFEGFLPAITGSHITRIMGMYVHLNDVTSKESRTFRVGMLNISKSIADGISSALSGVMLKYIGYYGVFLFCAVLLLCAIAYGLYIIDDPKIRDCTDDIEVDKERGFLKSFFDINHVKDSLSVSLKKGPNHRRTKMILLFISVFLIFGIKRGEINVRYLFTRFRFNWDALTYSFYNTFKFWTQLLGSLISMSVLVGWFKCQDATLGLLSNFSDILTALFTGFARNSTELYIGAALGFIPLTAVALRSITLKLCSKDELGKIMSVYNLIQMVATMVFSPIYSWIYIVSLNVDASLIYYISAMLTLPVFIILGWFYKQHNNTLQKEKPSEIDTTTSKSCDNEVKERTIIVTHF